MPKKQIEAQEETEGQYDALLGLKGDQFNVEASKTVTCTPYFEEWRAMFDTRELRCDALGGSQGDKSRKLKYLRLSGEQPFSFNIIEDGNENPQSATHFEFDEWSGVKEAYREVEKVAGLKEGTAKKINQYIKDGRTIISSPKEVADIIAIAEATDLNRRLLNQWQIAPATRTVLNEMRERENDICYGGRCKPILFLSWMAEDATPMTKILPLTCKDDDPKKGCSGVQIQFSSDQEWSCFIPGALHKEVKGIARELADVPHCNTPP